MLDNRCAHDHTVKWHLPLPWTESTADEIEPRKATLPEDGKGMTWLTAGASRLGLGVSLSLSSLARRAARQDEACPHRTHACGMALSATGT